MPFIFISAGGGRKENKELVVVLAHSHAVHTSLLTSNPAQGARHSAEG